MTADRKAAEIVEWLIQTQDSPHYDDRERRDEAYALLERLKAAPAAPSAPVTGEEIVAVLTHIRTSGLNDAAAFVRRHPYASERINTTLDMIDGLLARLKDAPAAANVEQDSGDQWLRGYYNCNHQWEQWRSDFGIREGEICKKCDTIRNARFETKSGSLSPAAHLRDGGGE